MASDWVVPALAALVSSVFAFAVARQFAARRRPYQLAWALGIGAYAIASLVEAYVSARGWTVPLYLAYFPLAAAPVGLLGLGTVYLMRPGTWGRVFAGGVVVAIAVAAIGPFFAGITLGDLTAGTSVGAHPVPYPNAGRVAFLALNVVGGLALIGGALWSWRRTRSHGVLLIGLGAMLPAAGGALSSLVGVDDRLMLQFLGIVVMYAGYARSREVPPRASMPSAA